MKRITMTKYGFERWAEQDFSDDGNRFYCYKVGDRVRVSKLTSNGNVFLYASIDGNILPYEVYSNLPHWSCLSKLNGVSIDSLTDDDLKKLFEDCVLYEQEYTKTERTIKMPTIDEIRCQCMLVQANKQRDLNKVELLIKNNILTLMRNLKEHQWKNVKYFYNNLLQDLARYDVSTYPDKIVGTSQSIGFCKSDSPLLKGLSCSIYYNELINMIESTLTN